MSDTTSAETASFQRVVCGVDPSFASTDAVVQAVALGDEGAEIWAVSVADPGLAMHAGIHAGDVMNDLRAECDAALRAASQAHPPARPVRITGGEVAGLIDAAANLRADLISVGSHGGPRAEGILVGSVAIGLAHHAPCPVLVARPAGKDFPRRIVHATDGSPESLGAARIAGRLAGSHDADVITVHVDGDGGEARAIAEESVALIESSGREPRHETRHGTAHREIVGAAEAADADLIVIGNRGRTGLKALGSVSEHVVHRGPCSVLVARRAAYPIRQPETRA